MKTLNTINMPNTSLRVALAQDDFPVGDIENNIKKHILLAQQAQRSAVDIVVFPELSITGYSPEDLLLNPHFIEKSNAALNELCKKIHDIYCLVSHPLKTSEGLFNACSMIYNGKIIAQYRKQHLPNYGVFDERRYFLPGNEFSILEIKNIKIGLLICEDIWHPDTVLAAKKHGAELILSPNASPFEKNKHEKRQRALAKSAQLANIPIVYVNIAGAQDDLIFDGGSMVVDATGKIACFAGFFNKNLLITDFTHTTTRVNVTLLDFSIAQEKERLYNALIMGTRDYIQKNHFKGALVGVSGGIDSALTLAIAVDALGADKVKAIILPSRYTSTLSMEEALMLVENLGVSHEIFSIDTTFDSFLSTLKPFLTEENNINKQITSITEQNLQARCRGVIMMAIANQTANIVLTTGNRSELAVGYTTLYGDMAGGLSILSDLPKTLVYQLAHYRNTLSPVIPERTLTRAPTAELAPDQKDSDSLPPYDILDAILEKFIDHNHNADEIVAAGFDRAVVEHVIALVYRNEYKRRQAPIGLRLHPKAFGRDRRYPVTCGFKG